MSTQSNKSLRDYIMKSDISENHERIIRNLFNALFVSERQHSIKTDHSPSDANVRTLDIYQVQQLIQSHCDKLITHMEIVDALYDLTDPQLLQPATVHFNSELDGQRISAMRLFYKCSGSENSDTGTDKLAKELSRVDLAMPTQPETDSEQSWETKVFELYEQQTIDRDTIQSLRTIIIDMAETLHVADPNARISMTSSDLLDLVHSQKDMSDNAF